MADWQPTRRQVLGGAAVLLACGPVSRLAGDAAEADAESADAGAPDAGPDMGESEAPPTDDTRAGGRARSDGNVLLVEDPETTRWVSGSGNYALTLSGAGIEIESPDGDGGLYDRGLGPALEHDVRRMFGESVLGELRRRLG